MQGKLGPRHVLYIEKLRVNTQDTICACSRTKLGTETERVRSTNLGSLKVVLTFIQVPTASIGSCRGRGMLPLAISPFLDIPPAMGTSTEKGQYRWQCLMETSPTSGEFLWKCMCVVELHLLCVPYSRGSAIKELWCNDKSGFVPFGHLIQYKKGCCITLPKEGHLLRQRPPHGLVYMVILT